MLIAELERIASPFGDEAPSDVELGISQAQLVGWLEGLFHGIQATLFAQQMVAQQQPQTMTRAFPPGQPGQDGVPASTGAAPRRRTPGPTRRRIDWGRTSHAGRRRPWNGLGTSNKKSDVRFDPV